MAPVPESSTPEVRNELTEKYKEILNSNGIKDAVSEVIIEDTGLKGHIFFQVLKNVIIAHVYTILYYYCTNQYVFWNTKGEGFASLTHNVKVKFENPDKKALNLFVKVQTDNPSHIKMLTEMKAFEKEARFLLDYVKAAEELCASKG